MLVKIAKYISFCVDRRFYLIWPPVILLIGKKYQEYIVCSGINIIVRGKYYYYGGP